MKTNETVANLAEKAEEYFPLLECNVYRIRNDFFGDTITVTGLITAQDLIKQLKGIDMGQQLLLSEAMLRRDSDVFLDDLTVQDVERELKTEVRRVPNDGYELLDAIMGIKY